MHFSRRFYCRFLDYIKQTRFSSPEAELHFIDEEMDAFHHDNKLAVSSASY